ncbi:MAG: ferrochelatase [Nevskia sp.]
MNELARRSHAATPKTGVLLINLGTPEAPTISAIRRYLAQFLADPRVVEIPRLIWLPILYLFVLSLRPKRLTHAYAAVWTDEGSPLLAISRKQEKALRAALAAEYGGDVPVALAMTYGTPSIPAALAELDARNVRRIVVLPLYPQYSGSTTAAAYDAVFAELRQRRWLPELQTIGSYHDHPSYIAALANSVRRHWQAQGRGQHLLISFHGVPQRYVELGDPYYCQCQKTARLLAEALALAKDDYSVSFQSRFGRTPWVQPYTDQTVVKLAQAGVRTLDAICPGFSADCLETLEEVSLRYAEDFTGAGGERMRYIPALNDHPEHIEALCGVLAPLLQSRPFPVESPAQVSARCEQAVALEPGFTGKG